MALVPLTLAGALGSSTGYAHAVYMLTVNEPSITIAFFALLAGAGYLVSQHVGQAYEQLAITFARVSLILVNFGFWIGSLWGDYPGQTWAQGEEYRLWSNQEAWRAAHLHIPEIAFKWLGSPPCSKVRRLNCSTSRASRHAGRRAGDRPEVFPSRCRAAIPMGGCRPDGGGGEGDGHGHKGP